MEDALRLCELGFPDGTVAACGFQERGRGRLPGRSWESEPGRNLLFTILFVRPLPCPVQRLPVLAGLALSLAVEESFALETRVKWPNDLLHEGRKLAGVLCEARSGMSEHPVILAGIGLNANQFSFPAGLEEQVCSLARILGREVHLPTLLQRVLFALHAVLRDREWRDRLQKRLYGLGQAAVVIQAEGDSPPGVLRGLLRGVAGDGALLLEREGRVHAVYSGELRLLR